MLSPSARLVLELPCVCHVVCTVLHSLDGPQPLVFVRLMLYSLGRAGITLVARHKRAQRCVCRLCSCMGLCALRQAGQGRNA